MRAVFLGLVLALVACGADMTSKVRTTAVRDLECRDAEIVDADSGVYRIAGCGLQATYSCAESAALSVRCEQLFVSKLPESAPKASAGASLAKTR